MTNFIRIGKNSYLSKERIILISDELNSRPISELREKLKEENRVIKLTSGKEAKSFVFLENGYFVILSKKVNEIIESLNSQ